MAIYRSGDGDIVTEHRFFFFFFILAILSPVTSHFFGSSRRARLSELTLASVAKSEELEENDKK